ncbi:iron-containing redox enzyme family protein [Caulobacter hibisci]|nr:iron-containing redox enzyme family protein [Caulobacter hibisci]
MQNPTAPMSDPTAPDDMLSAETQQRLSNWNHVRLEPGAPTADWEQGLADELSMRRLEGRFVESQRQGIISRAEAAPQDVEGFVAWFEALKATGPGQNDPLFPWLAQSAPLEDMRWFLQQEVAGEAGFDDLVALTQVKMPVQAKLELARNYWDEMGRGAAPGMHGPMLDELAGALNLNPIIADTVPASLALGNLLVAFATNRRYAYHAIGALGVVELTAPWRADLVAKGLKRLGVGKERKYFALHATLDITHSEAWNAEVLTPLVQERPHCARFIAEGALMRLEAGRRCFEAYRQQLWSREIVAA